MATADELSEAFDLVLQQMVNAAHLAASHATRTDGLSDRIKTLEEQFAATAGLLPVLHRLVDRIDALEEKAAQSARVFERLNERVGGLECLEQRMLAAEARAAQPHDFGGVTSTGEAKMGHRIPPEPDDS